MEGVLQNTLLLLATGLGTAGSPGSTVEYTSELSHPGSGNPLSPGLSGLLCVLANCAPRQRNLLAERQPSSMKLLASVERVLGALGRH